MLASAQIHDIFKSMLFANDTTGTKTYIDDAKPGEEYHCPLCDEKLICKFGDIRSHHFAHAARSDCKDSWHYDMSEWHSLWQSYFPKENQEVVFSRNGEKHRADVAIGNVIIEFQHSRISSDEFYERNTFYHSLGKKIIWVFDATLLFDWDFLGGDESMILALKKDSFFTNEEIRNSADTIFLSQDMEEDQAVYEDAVFQLYQTSWFKLCRDKYTGKRRVMFGPDSIYNNKEFIDILLGKAKAEKNHGTITYLWRKNNVTRWAIFENSSGFRVKITKDPAEQYMRYGRLYGNYSAPRKMKFNTESKQVYGVSDVWNILSFK